MILSDITIKEMVKSGKIKIYPNIDEHHIRPTGIRVHLGEDLLLPVENQTIDITEHIDIKYKKIKIDEKGFILSPNMFVLGSTYESILMPSDIVGQLEGRSTVARVGMAIHCTSSIIDSMHNEDRKIVLEIKNIGNFNIVLRPKMPIGMLVFIKLSTHVEQQSQSQYKNQNSTVAPNLHFQPIKLL